MVQEKKKVSGFYQGGIGSLPLSKTIRQSPLTRRAERDIKRKRPGVTPVFSAGKKGVHNERVQLSLSQADQADGAPPLKEEVPRDYKKKFPPRGKDLWSREYRWFGIRND